MSIFTSFPLLQQNTHDKPTGRKKSVFGLMTDCKRVQSRVFRLWPERCALARDEETGHLNGGKYVGGARQKKQRAGWGSKKR